MAFETWEEMTDRHREEKRNLLQNLQKSGLRKSEAADILDVSLSSLDNMARRYDVDWPRRQTSHAKTEAYFAFRKMFPQEEPKKKTPQVKKVKQVPKELSPMARLAAQENKTARRAWS